jgi:hypothetical protein
LRALHKHRDRRSNALIDERHEYLILVAKEDSKWGAGLGCAHGNSVAKSFLRIGRRRRVCRPRGIHFGWVEDSHAWQSGQRFLLRARTASEIWETATQRLVALADWCIA